MAKKLALIINPCSGMMQGVRHFDELAALFMEGGYEVLAFFTGKQGDGSTLAVRAAALADVIVCVGGDGTLNEVLSGLVGSGSKLPVGYIPAGTTNDFAATLGLSPNPVQAARDILQSVPTPLDVGAFDSRYFVYTASFGAFTGASYETPQQVKNVLGHAAYVLQGIRDIPSIRPCPLTITCHSDTFAEEYIFGAVSNSTSLGGVLPLPQQSVDLSDGLFEVLLVRMPRNPAELHECLHALTHQRFDSPMLRFLRTRELELDAPEDMPWSLDGEYAAGQRHIRVRNLRHAATLLLKPKPSQDDPAQGHPFMTTTKEERFL